MKKKYLIRLIIQKNDNLKQNSIYTNRNHSPHNYILAATGSDFIPIEITISLGCLSIQDLCMKRGSKTFLDPHLKMWGGLTTTW